jgi:hypothetical protein
MFIDGKKFPLGVLPEKKWRVYIHDLLLFLSNFEIHKTLLDIDPETFF